MSARPSRASRARPSLARVARACALVAIAFAAIARAAPDADVSTDDVAADAPEVAAGDVALRRGVAHHRGLEEAAPRVLVALLLAAAPLVGHAEEPRGHGVAAVALPLGRRAGCR